jgi:hypothetical protein
MNGKRVKGLLAAWLVGKGVLLPIVPRQRPLLWLFEHSEGGSLVKRRTFYPRWGCAGSSTSERILRILEGQRQRVRHALCLVVSLYGAYATFEICVMRVTAVDQIVRPGEDDRFP